MTVTRRGILGLCGAALAALAAGCRRILSDERATLAAERDDLGEAPIDVSVVWSRNPKALLLEGIEFAVEQINEEGGVLDRPIALHVHPDTDDSADPHVAAREQARRMARDPALVAVMGHGSTQSAVPAAIVYEESGLLYINPSVTDHSMNGFGFQYVFSTTPSNEEIAAQAATFSFSLGYGRLAILSNREDWAASMRKAFVTQAVTLGLTIVAQRSFFSGRRNFRDLLADFGALQFDGLLLITDKDAAGAIIAQALEMNLRTRFVLSRPIDPVALRHRVGRETPHIAMPSLFNPYTDSYLVRRFRETFGERYGVDPDAWAAQGYDAVRMLAHAIRQADSTVPLSLATILRYTLSWNGLTGRHSFDRKGSIYTKEVAFATLEEGTILFFSPTGGVTPLPEDEARPAADVEAEADSPDKADADTDTAGDTPDRSGTPTDPGRGPDGGTGTAAGNGDGDKDGNGNGNGNGNDPSVILEDTSGL